MGKWVLPAIVLCSLVLVPPAEAQFKVLRWHTTLESAQEAARASGKPLFIVFRCVPCAGCREWDALVSQSDKDIAEAREGFVCARIPQMNGVDISRFEHDFDTTWAGYFTDADLNIYSRFGGRDETDAEARLSKTALLTTMREVRAAHEERRRRGASFTAELVHPEPSKPAFPDEIPQLEENHSGCIHCHQVQEYRLRQAYVDGRFSRQLVFGYPLPENLGIAFDRSHGHKVEKVSQNTFAAKTGLQPGDVITRVNDVPVRSEQDIRWALHRAPESGPVAITVSRETGGTSQSLRLEGTVAGNWKQTELAWRKSLRSVPLPLGFLGYALSVREMSEYGLSKDQLAIRVISLRGQGLAAGLGLQKDDVIVKADGKSTTRTLEEFKSDLLRAHDPGSEVVLTVRRGKTTAELRGKMPEWFLDLTVLP